MIILSFYKKQTNVLINSTTVVGIKICCFLFLLMICGELQSQNLVLNPSFEEPCKCMDERGRPYNVSRVNRFVPHWRSPNGGTPDHYRPGCNDKRSAPPQTYGGFCVPHSDNSMIGFGFIGMRLLQSENSGEREYVETKLIRPLERNKNYCVSFYIFPAQYSSFRTDRVEVLFSNHRTSFKKNFKPILSEFSLADTTISEIVGWHLVKFIFKAKGGERFLTIGNFSSNAQSKMIDNISNDKRVKKKQIPGAYYFIDDVTVEEYYKGCACDDLQMVEDVDSIPNKETYLILNPSDETPTDVRRIVLEDLNFETGSAILSQKELEQLEEVMLKLYEFRSLNLIIIGHTDNQGDELLNKELSYARANRVRDYMISRGFRSEHIEVSGVGSQQPRASNDTKEGRALNRRVEIIIVE